MTVADDNRDCFSVGGDVHTVIITPTLSNSIVLSMSDKHACTKPNRKAVNKLCFLALYFLLVVSAMLSLELRATVSS